MASTELKIGHFDESHQNDQINVSTMVFSFENLDGFIFAVLDIRGDKKNADEIYSIIDQELNDIAINLEKGENFQHCFEQLISTVNSEIEQSSSSKNWKLKADQISGLIGLAADQIMYITGAGEMVGIYLHQKDKTRYQIFNLFRGIQTEKAIANWEKIFSVVLDGDLHKGDIFLTANRELTNEVTKEDLMNILSTLPPSGAVMKLRQYFPLKTHFGAIVLKVDDRGLIAPPEKTESKASIEKMVEVESKTKRMLEDQRPQVTKLSVLMRILFDLGKILIAAIVIAAGLVWSLIKALGKISYTLIRTDRKETLKLTKSHTDHFVDSFVGRLNRLPKTSKYVLLAIIALIVVFIISVLFISRGKAVERENDLFVTSLQAIEERRDEAMASIIYHDENQARTLLFQALDMINATKITKEEQTIEIESLRNEIELALDDLRRVTTIEQPTVLADLRSTESTAEASNITLSNNGLLLFANNQSVYQLDLENKTLNLIDVSSDAVGTAMASGWDDTNNLIFFLDDRPGLSLFDPDQNILTDMSADLIGSIPDIEVYARRIYAVSPETEQILRYDRVGYDFGSGSAWIESHQTSLTDAVSITIDGSIYLLKADGTFVKFDSGNEVSWSHDLIDPALSSDKARIWSTDTSDFMYVLDPDQKRVLVIRKETGALIVQYYSENFTDLKDFIVDEESGQIYLLAGTQILSIEAVHLN
ncbi:MAG: hypothetical protein ABIH67_01430 [Candidatus Uhrbacteria bacterium]